MVDTSLDTNAEIRWGDQEQLDIDGSGTTVDTSGQLVTMRRDHPETWSLALFVTIPPQGGGAFLVVATFTVIFGSGSAQVRIPIRLQLDTTATAVTENYAGIVTPNEWAVFRVDLPANAIQVQAEVFGNITETVQVAAFIAPRFYQVDDPPPTDVEPGYTAMPPGFYPEELRYHVPAASVSGSRMPRRR